jgi:hypothetical protein
MRFFTYTLTAGSLNISAEDGAMFLSLQTDAAGACTVQGNIPFKGIPSSAVTISAGSGLNIVASSPQSPLDGITITYSSGNIDVLIGF